MSDQYYSIEAGAGVDKAVLPAATATPMVSVVAPATLPEGYTFDAEVNGTVFTVTVPQGGVKEGQTFMAPMIVDSTSVQDYHKVPHGRWRDGLFNCFGVGICHPSLCLTYWCRPLALAQIMTRMQLNFCGEQKGPAAASNTFKYMLVLWLVYFGTEQVLGALVMSYTPQEPNDDSVTIEYSTTYWALYGVLRALQFMFGIYMLVIIIRTRSLVREKYSIPEENCVGCEDCCCGVFCNCCVVAQMARHTADYDTYPAACCTNTGLPSNVPGIV